MWSVDPFTFHCIRCMWQIKHLNLVYSVPSLCYSLSFVRIFMSKYSLLGSVSISFHLILLWTLSFISSVCVSHTVLSLKMCVSVWSVIFAVSLLLSSHMYLSISLSLFPLPVSISLSRQSCFASLLFSSLLFSSLFFFSLLFSSLLFSFLSTCSAARVRLLSALPHSCC